MALDAVESKRQDPSAEWRRAKELVGLATVPGISLTRSGGLLGQLTKNVLETALKKEMSKHVMRVSWGADGCVAPGDDEFLFGWIWLWLAIWIDERPGV